MPFEPLPHTGDLAYRVTGATREDLFAEAARALFSTITELAAVHPKAHRTVTAQGAAPAELLVEFLRACLQIFSDEEFIAQSVDVKLGNGVCDATLRGEVFDPTRHPFQTEVKAVTYHDATVKQTEDGWEATFTLDL